MTGFLKGGNVFALVAGMKFYTDVPTLLLYVNGEKGQTSKGAVTAGDVLGKGKIKFDTRPFLGEYVVVNTDMTGGGSGHGGMDYYPDGWEVTAHKLGADGQIAQPVIEISFYQSGAFSAENRSVPVLRKMALNTKITLTPLPEVHISVSAKSRDTDDAFVKALQDAGMMVESIIPAKRLVTGSAVEDDIPDIKAVADVASVTIG